MAWVQATKTRGTTRVYEATMTRSEPKKKG